LIVFNDDDDAAATQVDTLSNESVSLVRLRCPYGRSGENRADWSRGSKTWDVLVSSTERERLAREKLADGEFYMSFSDFVQTFTTIECVHLDAETSRDEPTLQGKSKLNEKTPFLHIVGGNDS
jgi:hypothetical protein